LAKALGVRAVPDVNDGSSVGSFLNLCRQHKLDPGPGPHTSIKLYDTLVEHFLESQCVQPTFLLHFPQAMSPLARQHRTLVRHHP